MFEGQELKLYCFCFGDCLFCFEGDDLPRFDDEVGQTDAVIYDQKMWPI